MLFYFRFFVIIMSENVFSITTANLPDWWVLHPLDQKRPAQRFPCSSSGRCTALGSPHWNCRRVPKASRHRRQNSFWRRQPIQVRNARRFRRRQMNQITKGSLRSIAAGHHVYSRWKALKPQQPQFAIDRGSRRIGHPGAAACNNFWWFAGNAARRTKSYSRVKMVS